jgi:citrate synthase
VTEWIGAAEAAERLGIKPASLYAYVSRGVLTRRRDSDRRASMFDAAEVAELARKGKPRRPVSGPDRSWSSRSELVIETAITEITDSTLRYRGLDATWLARNRSFEDVAVLLWSGYLPDARDGAARDGAARDGAARDGAARDGAARDGAARDGAARDGAARDGAARDGAARWQATPEALAVGAAAQAALPPGTLPLERLQVIVPALAATDQLRLHLDRPAVMAAGRALIAGMAGALASAPDHPPAVADESPIAARLASRLCTEPVPAGLTDVVGVALVLLADHELAASTLAARVAASMRADPYAVVATGLGAMGGAVHAGAALGAELMLASAESPDDVPRVVGDLLRRGERLPGFGHFVYKDGDPRANLLLEIVANYAAGSPRLAVAAAVIAEVRRRSLPEPNIEFALATLVSVAGMVRGAGEAIFAVARTAGWLAHALEEYERNVPIRPRGVYVGLEPPSA